MEVYYFIVYRNMVTALFSCKHFDIVFCICNHVVICILHLHLTSDTVLRYSILLGISKCRVLFYFLVTGFANPVQDMTCSLHMTCPSRIPAVSVDCTTLCTGTGVSTVQFSMYSTVYNSRHRPISLLVTTYISSSPASC